jgi:ubiquinone/menaquinone biosynthesis C-methylase UbiE
MPMFIWPNRLELGQIKLNLAEHITKAGWQNIGWQNLTGGVVAVHSAVAP